MSRTSCRLAIPLALFLAVGALPALAAEEATGAEAAAPLTWRLGLRLGGFDMLQSQDSYDAVYGEAMPQLGLAVEVGFARRWLLALTYDYGEVDGEQVLPTRPPRRTGVGTTLTYRPLALTAAVVLNPESPWWVTLGAGATWLDWEEKGAVRSASGTDAGGHGVLGVRRRDLGGRWDLGGELRYSTIPDAVGEAGITAFFGEDDLGGLALHAVVLYRLR